MQRLAPFRGACCRHLQCTLTTLKMKAAGSSETLPTTIKVFYLPTDVLYNSLRKQ